MRDWAPYVRDNLALTELKQEHEAKIIEDLARQLEDFYREGLSRNLTETEADAYAREQIKDWDCLESGGWISLIGFHSAIGGGTSTT